MKGLQGQFRGTFLDVIESMRNQKSIAAITTLIALALMLIPASAAGQTPEEMAVKVAVDNAGITIDKLMVIPVEGIVIVRGRVATPEVHKRLAQVLTGLDLRIANLVKILPIPDDVQIQLAAERALHTTRTLDGSKLRVSANN